MNKKEIEIKEIPIDEKVERGEYSNLVKIYHSPVDFRFDFLRTVPDEGKFFIINRIYMSAVHAKLFLNALRENVESYEKKFGRIEISFGESSIHVNQSKSLH